MLILSNKSISVVKQFIQENEVLVYRYMVLAIAEAIRKNKERAEFFSFGRNTENVAVAKPADYETILTDAIGHFTKAEEYEFAAHARDTLRKWKVEQLLNDDRSE